MSGSTEPSSLSLRASTEFVFTDLAFWEFLFLASRQQKISAQFGWNMTSANRHRDTVFHAQRPSAVVSPFRNDRYKKNYYYYKKRIIIFFKTVEFDFDIFIIRITSDHISWWKQSFFFFFYLLRRCFSLLPTEDLRGLRRSLPAKAGQDAAWSLFKMCANDAH